MKNNVFALSVLGLFAVSACSQNVGNQIAENATPDRYAGKSCAELTTLLNEYADAGQALHTNDTANAIGAVAGMATAVNGNPGVGAAMMTNSIGQDQTEQQVQTAGQAQYNAVMVAGQNAGCW